MDEEYNNLVTTPKQINDICPSLIDIETGQKILEETEKWLII